MHNYTPLAEKLRPKELSHLVGQEHIIGDSGIVSLSIKKQKPLSILFWGPPGCGKTTLAKIYAKAFQSKLITISAVSTGVSDLKKIIHNIESQPLFHQTPFLFIDEIHRYNKAQQDLILPYLEKGTFLLIGATTENPSFSLNDALLSRLRVLTLNSLNEAALEKIILSYEKDYSPLKISEEARGYLKELAQGDGRYLLNMIESIQDVLDEGTLTIDKLKHLLQQRAALFDRAGDGHYNLISALHKSIRGSDPDAALYWFTRMIEGGEAPLFIARRLIRMASEDVGLADPNALQQAVAARDAYQHLGSPEGELALAQVVVYLALAPKSNAIYTAFKSSLAAAKTTSQLPPPATILNAPTKLMKEKGYGKGYIYDHDTVNGFSGQSYFPEALDAEKFYHPVERGFEREMKKRLAYFHHLRSSLNNNEK
ncbi:MAG: replication-associated recombination protein A [Chlamydiota bacterium]|nr:replication-associated recombination protein A [Chlamydiota bacterium]